MKKRFSKLLAILLVLALMPLQITFVSASSVQEDYEDFEPEMLLVQGSASHILYLQGEGVTQWGFFRPRYRTYDLNLHPANFIQSDDGVNTGKFVSSGATALGDAEKTPVIRNLPAEYSNATVTHEIRLKKPTKGVLRYNLCDSIFNNDVIATGGERIAQIAIRANGSVEYIDEFISASSKVSKAAGITLTEASPWVYVRLIIDLPNKTIKPYYGMDISAMSPWDSSNPNKAYNFMARGSSGSFRTAQGKLASLLFSADTSGEAYQLAFDDVKTYYGAGPLPVAMGLSTNNDTVIGHTIQGTYSDFIDPRGNTESGSVAIWKSADDAAFKTNVAILKTEPISEGGISTYTFVAADNNKYIKFAIVPKSSASDFNEGMESAILLPYVVRMPTTLPTVRMLRPYTDTRFFEGDPILLKSEAVCDDTSITKIEYYANETLIGQSTTAPYSIKWSGGAVDTYSIYAKAYNALGQSNVSTDVSIKIRPARAISDEYDTLREKWRLQLTGGTLYDIENPYFQKHIDRIDAEAEECRAAISASTTYSTNVSYLPKVESMALAYTTNGSKYQGNEVLRDEIITAFTALNTNCYNEEFSGFFWGKEFGYPMNIGNTLSMMYEELPTSLINKYVSAIKTCNPAVGYTYANRMWDAQAIMLSGVIEKNSARINMAKEGMKAAYAYTTSGEGFYADGSFIQHGSISYNGGYGKSLFREMARMMDLLSGTSFEITDPNAANFYNIAYDSYAAFIYKGEFMDMTRGREITSPISRNSHRIGHQAIHGFVELTQFAPEPHKTNYKRLVKKWIIQDTYKDLFTTDLPLDVLRIAKEIMDDPSIMPAEETSRYLNSAGMARAVHLRPTFGVGLSMSSNRIADYEPLDGNGYAWYTGAGMMYLYNNDINQYADHFWETINWYRLPGTTVDTIARSNSENWSQNKYNWVGGTDLEGLYGVNGFQYGKNRISQYIDPVTLEAKKSWFMLDDEVVCLGAGITSTDNRPIETIVENRKIRNDFQNVLTIDGTAQPVRVAWDNQTDGARWFHLSGNVENSDIGYYFPDDQQINILRENRYGANKGLYELSAGYPKGESYLDPRNYVTMWIDHGANPTNATYSYVLLPDKSAANVDEYSENPDIIILENSPDIQSVKEKKLGIVAANFWNDGTASVGGITVDKKASVMTRKQGNTLEISVSDPTMANSGVINVELRDQAVETLSLSPGVTVVQSTPFIKLQINVNKALGKSFKAKFTVTETEPVTVLYGYYNKTTKMMLDCKITNDIDEPYTPPTVSNPLDYEVRKFIWDGLESVKPID